MQSKNRALIVRVLFLSLMPFSASAQFSPPTPSPAVTFAPATAREFIVKKDYAGLKRYASAYIPDERQIYAMDRDNPILFCIDSGDVRALDILLAAKYPGYYGGPSLGRGDSKRSLPYYCLVTHNLPMLKQLYARGLRLTDEGKDMLTYWEWYTDCDDIISAVDLRNDDELLLFLWKNESNHDKYYQRASGGSGLSTVVPFTHYLLRLPDFIRLVELFGLQNRMNDIGMLSPNAPPGFILRSLLDAASDALEMARSEHEQDEWKSKIAYITAHGGLPTMQALPLMPRKSAKIIRYGDGVCTAGELYVRDAPDAEKGKIIGHLLKGEKTILLNIVFPNAEDRTPWYLVYTETGLVGYSSGRYIEASTGKYE